MEEVWNDINLSSLHQYNSNNTTHDHQPTFHFQDFFSDPKLLIDPPSLTPNDASSRDLASNTTTALSLGNCASRSSSIARQISNKKRARFNVHCETGDQRHTRLMKSRESADRSRAKKQAYINEMEQKVDKLMKENARLKSQMTQTQFYLAKVTTPEPVEVSKRSTLSRTLTAPF